MNEDNQTPGWKYNSDKFDPNKKSLSKENLKNSEKKGPANSLEDNQDNSLWNPNVQKSNLSKIFNKKNNKKLLGGGIAGGLITLIFFGFAGIATYELQTIAKVIGNEEDKVVKEMMYKASKHIFKNVMCWKTSVCKKEPPPDDPAGETPPEETAPTEEQAAKNGEGLTNDISNFNLTDPNIESMLNQSGITVEKGANGSFNLLNSNGSPLTPEDITSDTSGVFERIDAAMPEFKVGEITSFRDLMFKFANSDWNILPDTPNDTASNATKDIQNADAVGATGTIAEFEAKNLIEDQSTNNSPSQQPIDQQALSDATNTTGDINSAETNVISDLQKGETASQAVADSTKTLESSLDLKSLASGITSISALAFVQDGCLFDELMNNQIIKHIPLIISLLIRNGTTTLSLASQLTSGKITGSEFSSVMKMYNGNPTAKSGSQSSLPFSASSAWKGATGGTGGIPIDRTSLPSNDGVMKVMGNINNDINFIPGARTVCNVSNSTAGSIAITIGGIALSGGIDFSTFGTGQALITGVTTALPIAIAGVVPYIIKTMVPVHLLGFQNAVQNMNNTDAGLNLANNNYSRSMGGMPQSQSQSVQNNTIADTMINTQQSRLSFFDRTFALSNPYSLISRFAVNIPLNFSMAIFSALNYISRIPVILFHGFSSIIISPSVYAATQNQNYPGKQYNLTQYAISSTKQNYYNPIINEQYLFSRVTYEGYSARRIDMLGNPNTIFPGEDTNNNDLLHCFYDSYTTIYSATASNGNQFNPSLPTYGDPGADHNCGALGLYNLSDYKDNGASISGLPNEKTIASIYCNYLLNNTTHNIRTCMSTLLSDGQINHDLTHFRQYLLDLSVMRNYTNMMSTSP
jgi:hypothetical protein